MTTGISLTPKAFSGYWQGPAKLQNVTYEYIADETTRIDGLESGSVNAAVVSTEGARALKGASGVTLQRSVSGKTTYLGFDVKSGPMDNVDLRRAASDAIDRSALTTSLLDDGGTPTAQMVAPPIVGYDSAVEAPVQNLAQARSLVKASGYSGQVIPFEYPVGDYVPESADVAQAVSADLGDVGIKTSLVGLPFATFLTDFFSRSLSGIPLFAFATNSASSEYQLLDSAAPFTNSRVTQPFAQQAAATNATTGLKLLEDIDLEYDAQAYFAPLYAIASVYATTKNIKVAPRVDGELLPFEMAHV